MDLGLNEQHQNIIMSYMQFAKYQRNQNTKFIEMSFQDIKDARLNDATYTKDEVIQLLEELQDLIRGEVEADLIEISHTNVLLFTQLFTQAEKWHLRMTVDLSEIQNRELLDKVKVLEENEGKAQPERRKLQPVTDSSGTLELLRIEIERLKKENERLDSEIQTSKTQLKDFENENLQLKEKVDEKDNKIKELSETPEVTESPEDNIDKNNFTNIFTYVKFYDYAKEIKVVTNASLEGKGSVIEQMIMASSIQYSKGDSESLLGEYEKVLRDQLSLELESMRQEMLSVQSQLSLAEQELERKFNETSAYANMKTMINKKNEQVKELRNQLMKYEKVDNQE